VDFRHSAGAVKMRWRCSSSAQPRRLILMPTCMRRALSSKPIACTTANDDRTQLCTICVHVTTIVAIPSRVWRNVKPRYVLRHTRGACIGSTIVQRSAVPVNFHTVLSDFVVGKTTLLSDERQVKVIISRNRERAVALIINNRPSHGSPGC
jgi:hypothetical protein